MIKIGTIDYITGNKEIKKERKEDKRLLFYKSFAVIDDS